MKSSPAVLPVTKSEYAVVPKKIVGRRAAAENSFTQSCAARLLRKQRRLRIISEKRL